MNGLLNAFPAQWGGQLEVEGAAVAVITTGPDTLRFRPDAHHFLVLFSPQPAWRFALGSGYGHTCFAPVGFTQILPWRSAVLACWSVEMDALVVAVKEDRIWRTFGVNAYQHIDWKMPGMGITDREALQMARGLRTELMGSAVARKDCVNAWVTLFVGHMLRHYSCLCENERGNHGGGLSAQARKRVDEYVLAKLGERISLNEMAAVASLSSSHFSRAFRTTFGVSPHQYVLNLRLKQAQHWMKESDLSLEEIARASGFSNNSHMTATMRKHFGATPSQLRYISRHGFAEARSS